MTERMLPVGERLAAHLTQQLGAWPPTPGEILVAGSPARAQPGWDGRVRPFAGLKTPAGTVLSVVPSLVDVVSQLLPSWGTTAFDDGLASALGEEGQGRRLVLEDGPVYRWSAVPTPGADVGEWVQTDDSRVPDWLRPFNGGVLCAWDDQGGYGAGVGIKRHDDHGQEIAVGTEPALRGRGVARALVATAARKILRDGGLPVYVHEQSNQASAHVADAAGFPDRGWRVVGFWPRRDDDTAK